MVAAFDHESPRFPRSDWQYEVSNGDTSLGYFEWLVHRYDSEEINPALDTDAVIAEWANLHYSVNFDAATEDKKAELRERYVAMTGDQDDKTVTVVTFGITDGLTKREIKRLYTKAEIGLPDAIPALVLDHEMMAGAAFEYLSEAKPENKSRSHSAPGQN